MPSMRTIKPGKQEPWPDGAKNALDVLDQRFSPHKVIGQGGVEPNPKKKWVVSTGMSFCSGLILKTRGKNDSTFCHIQDFTSEIPDHLERLGPQPPREAVFVYGTNSKTPIELIKLMQGGRWGQISLASIKFDTGPCSWFLAYNPKSGMASIVRLTPEHSIINFKPF